MADRHPGQRRLKLIIRIRYHASLNADFDLTFAEFDDRDDAYKVNVQGISGAAWTSTDYDNQVAWLSTYSAAANQRVALWQIPMGNRKMRAENNTAKHYQSSQVETLLDDTGRTRLKQYRDAGVIAFLFGGGAGGVTCPCDQAGDGITDPPPINGNDRPSLSDDDDGGYFRERATAYYAAGPLPLP